MNEETITKNCEKHGDYEAKCLGILTKKIYSNCPECEKERKIQDEIDAKAKAEQDEIDKRNAQERRRLENGLLRRYLWLTLEDFEPTEGQQKAYKACLKFVEQFEEMEKKGQTLIFCGNVGTGKTMLVHALMQSLGYGYYIRAVDISREVRGCYAKNLSEKDVIDNWSMQSLLVIDEVGVQQDTKNESMLITDLIDRRYGDLRPTIICTNLNKEKLAEVFGERAWSRLNQNCAIIPITGESNR